MLFQLMLCLLETKPEPTPARYSWCVIVNLCLIGFGNVGQNLAQHVLEQSEAMQAQFGLELRITGVATRRMGFVTDAEGLNLKALLDGRFAPEEPFRSGRVGDWLERARANMLIELSSLEPHAGQPATQHLEQALRRGIHGITANKGPLVHAFHPLEMLARENGVKFRFEAATCDCLPVYSLFREALPLARPTGFRGLVNNTTSVILETIERGGDFESGVREAQARGVAETDPGHDVDGFDCAVKIVGIANVLMNAQLKLEDVERVGIRDLDPLEVKLAYLHGTPIRMVSTLERDGETLRASVKPVRLERNDPLNGLDAMSLALHFEMNMLPGLTIVGYGLDARSTAYGVLTDVINVARGR